jgi:hypothetical protein
MRSRSRGRRRSVDKGTCGPGTQPRKTITPGHRYREVQRSPARFEAWPLHHRDQISARGSRRAQPRRSAVRDLRLHQYIQTPVVVATLAGDVFSHLPNPEGSRSLLHPSSPVFSRVRDPSKLRSGKFQAPVERLIPNQSVSALMGRTRARQNCMSLIPQMRQAWQLGA